MTEQKWLESTDPTKLHKTLRQGSGRVADGLAVVPKLFLIGIFLLSFAQCSCVGKSQPPKADQGKTTRINAGIDPNDPSVVYDEPFYMNTGVWTYNGSAYDKSALWIDPNAKLILPDTATNVVQHDQANVVLIYMEKRMFYAWHVDHSEDIAERRRHMGCAVKLDKGSLMIGSFGEFSFFEGGCGMKFLILVPPKVEVTRRFGLVGGPGGRGGGKRSQLLINPEEGQPMPPLIAKKDCMPECWFPPKVEDGWHEIPSVADSERRVSK
jgi:hypothetical protein